ncbi:hypothetical protein MNBD_ALPHA05-887 [hydrothermal vent metagenome]|uniref:Uncharacterized protein n=1 Tax=hydrothermal vent metagenome TaxID=652676 RepID=A0A3B0S2F0_9ZZZZ
MRLRLTRFAACFAGVMTIVSACGVAYSQSLYPGPPAPKATAPDGETVRYAITAALTHNPEIEVARSREQAASADRLRAVGRFLPNIEATVSYADDSLRSPSLGTLEDRDGTTLGFTASQPIFQGLSAINGFREARARLSQSKYLLMSARQQVALSASQAHSGVILARQIVAHRQANLKLVNRQFEIAERRRQAGAQSRTGVEQAKMRRAQAQVDLGRARAFVADREAAYARIVGHEPPQEMIIDPATEDFGLDTRETALSAALANNPSLNAARASAKAAKHAKSAAKGGFAPTLALEGTYFRRYGAGVLPADEKEYQVVARARVPIFAQGRNYVGLKSASAAAAETNAQLRGTRLFVEETISRSWRQLADAEARRIAAAHAINAAAASVKGLQIEYETGRRTVIDVLNGQRDLVIAMISLSQAEHDYRIIQYELAATAGRLLTPGNE